MVFSSDRVARGCSRPADLSHTCTTHPHSWHLGVLWQGAELVLKGAPRVSTRRETDSLPPRINT
jgi:hypothetical protein